MLYYRDNIQACHFSILSYSMVDYRKWDNLQVSSDEDDDAAERPRGQPAVYRVGQGESLHIPGRNVTLTSGPR